METHGHEEGTETRNLANLVVVVEFRHGQPVRPIVLQEVGENPKILLDVLVDTFGLSIGLWVIGRRGVRLYAQELQQIPHEVSHELCPSVTNHHLGQPEVLPHMVTVNACHPFSVQVLGARHHPDSFP
jgi:hypothetical protein